MRWGVIEWSEETLKRKRGSKEEERDTIKRRRRKVDRLIEEGKYEGGAKRGKGGLGKGRRREGGMGGMGRRP